MEAYHRYTDAATRRFAEMAAQEAIHRERERRLTTLAASVRIWPHIPRSIIRLAIAAIEYGTQPLMTRIRWNFSYTVAEQIECIGIVLVRMGARQ
jgi:hypothetical protein